MPSIDYSRSIAVQRREAKWHRMSEIVSCAALVVATIGGVYGAVAYATRDTAREHEAKHNICTAESILVRSYVGARDDNWALSDALYTTYGLAHEDRLVRAAEYVYAHLEITANVAEDTYYAGCMK